jgi:phosphotriesterase-related protein
MTVTGPVAPGEMGLTLPHEHVMVDFIGADEVSRDRYDPDEVYEVALPHLERARSLGCRTLVECTPAYIGRDAALLERLSSGSGLAILTNTGYYVAANDKFVPAHAYEETADELADRWTREWEEGIEGTEIRPGFVKIGVDGGPLSEIDRKLVVAAGHAHLRTGLTIAAHTGNGKAAEEQLSALHDLGVDGSAWIWVHAQSEGSADLHGRAAEQGAWLEFDGIGPATVERHVAMTQEMKERGHLDRVLVSHDAGWYNVGDPGGGTFRPYDTLFTHFIPALKEAGFTAEEIRRVTVENPARAFTVGVRARA